MPDIAMCKGDGCPRKADCYRYRAVPEPRRQAYFSPPPVRADGTCNDFLELRRGDRLTDVASESA